MLAIVKYVRWILVSILIVFLLVIGSGITVSLFYGKEITRYVLDGINKSVNTDIRVASMGNISIFSKFPFASLSLYEVLMKENNAGVKKDTLFYAGKIYLQFNILDILRGEYKIKRISISDGQVFLRIDEKGNENYRVGAGSGEKDFFLSLSRMNLSRMQLVYINEVKEQEFRIQCREAMVKGNFSSEDFVMSLEGDFFAEKMKTEGVDFLSGRTLGVKADLQVNNRTGLFALESGELVIDNKLKFGIEGTVAEKKHIFIPDIKIEGKGLALEQIFGILPAAYKNTFKDYHAEGKISFNCHISGEYSNELSPAVIAAFSIDKGSFTHQSTSYSLNAVSINGSYTNGKKKNPGTSVIDISSLRATFGKGKNEMDGNITAVFRIKDLNNPKIKLSAKGNLDLGKLQKFISIDTLENISGDAVFNIQYEGLLKSKDDYTTKDFKNSISSGDIIFSGMNLKFRNSQHEYSRISGTLMLRNSDVFASDFHGNISSTDFHFNGLLRNAIGFLFVPEEKLTVEAEISSEKLNLNEILADEGVSSSYRLAFPADINVNLKAEFNELEFRKFSAKEVHSLITIRDHVLHAEKIFFKTMEGVFRGTLDIDATSQGNIIVTSEAKIERVDISKLFAGFENFGQDVITDRHLKGIASADVLFSMMMDSAMNVNDNNIRTLANLSIEKGELIEFEPMDDISGFIKNHVFLKRLIRAGEFEKKLKHIRFSTLTNTVQITDRKIIIPAMTINSSAMNIEAEGEHGFDNTLDYKMNFFLSELLTKKEDVSQEEFGEVEDDGTGKKKIFLTIRGTLDKPEITYDKKKVKKNLHQEATKEKNQIKGILKEEFGWFAKDSSAVYKKEKKKEDFVIEWNDADSAESRNRQIMPDSSKARHKNKGGNIKLFLDKIGQEEKKTNENEMDFENTDF